MIYLCDVKIQTAMKLKDLKAIIANIGHMDDRTEVELSFDNVKINGATLKEISVHPIVNDCTIFKCVVKFDGLGELDYIKNEISDDMCSEESRIRYAIRCNGGNMTKAAEMLGVSPRTIYRKVRQYDI